MNDANTMTKTENGEKTDGVEGKTQTAERRKVFVEDWHGEGLRLS